MNTGTFRGQGAEIRWGYQPAVVLGSWSVTATPAERTLTGRVIRSDALRVSQRPLTFVVHMPRGQRWCWPVTSLQIAGDEMTASLGPQE